jgi:hypothetical protein
LGVEGVHRSAIGSIDLGVEGFVEALGVSWCRICLDLGVEGVVEALGGSLCRVCLDLGVEGFVEALGVRCAVFVSIGHTGLP